MMDTLPDKIYISHLCDTTIDGEEGHLMAMSFEDNGGKKFIRKDALLEWAKKELESAEITNFDEFGRGEVVTWTHVIEKIKEL